jgi:SAM-dependent methyltransferase
MTEAERIRVFDSQGEDYKQAFQVFLEHTDQKRNAKRWLQHVVDGLAMRNVFIDAGAGNGEVTAALAPAFDRTIAIEPNPYLLSQLQQAIPRAEAIGDPILVANPTAQADLVLCSHTLYYIPGEQWLAHLERLVSWMSPTGVTIVIVQNQGTGCMAMLDRFFGHRFNLTALADAFHAKHQDRYEVLITVDQAHVDVPDAISAFTVAEFMLNLLPIRNPPSRRDVEMYVAETFRNPQAGYRFSVHQGFLQIRPESPC